MEECLDIAHEFGVRPREAAAHLMLGYVFEALGDSTAAYSNFEASAAIARELGDKGRLSFALNALAGLYQEARNLDAAVPLFEEALGLTRELDDQESISIHLTNLARALVDRGTTERTRELLAEASAVARTIGSARGSGYVVEVAAGLAAFHGDFEKAARFYGAVPARFKEIGLRRTPADDAFLDSQMAKAREAIGDAAFATAEAKGRAMPWDSVQDDVRAWLST
jgi:tetratricopeptide (TPR) repeat protein